MQKSICLKLKKFFRILVSLQRTIIPGPPFLVGACIVLLAFLVALFIPEHSKASSTRKHSNSISSTLSNNVDRSSEEDVEPLLQDSSLWRLTSEETMEQIRACWVVQRIWSLRGRQPCTGEGRVLYHTWGWYHTCRRVCLAGRSHLGVMLLTIGLQMLRQILVLGRNPNIQT